MATNTSLTVIPQYVLKRAVSKGNTRHGPMGMETCEVKVHLKIEDYVFIKLRDAEKDSKEIREEIRQEIAKGISEFVIEHLDKYADVSVDSDYNAMTGNKEHVMTVRVGICPVKEI